MFLLSRSIYTGRDKALQIIWTLCQYVINITSQQFPVAQMVEHGASNAKIMGSIPRESKSW